MNEHVLIVFIAFLVLVLVIRKWKQQKKLEDFTHRTTTHTRRHPRSRYNTRSRYYPYYRAGYLSIDPRCDAYCMQQHQNCMRVFHDPTKCLSNMNNCLQNCYIVG